MTDLDPSELATIKSMAQSGDIRRDEAPVILRLVSEVERLRRIEAAALVVSTKAQAVASCMKAEAQEDRALQVQGNLVGQIVFGNLVESITALDAALAGRAT